MALDKQLEQLIEFSKAFGMHYQENYLISPPKGVKELRNNLIIEEAFEVGDELLKDKVDVVKLAKELADLLYVTYGTIVAFGLQHHMEAVFDEVHRSNMSKLEDGKVIRREDGKALKGKDYSPADIEKILN